jgi:eukaryotic-like serine/threonine-protein kinase
VQIARGLAAAHEKGAVHRDLKPDNIFLTASGQVKILDFGLARSMTAADAAPNTVTRPAVTDAGTVLGTAGYMAPEQVRGQVVDARADLFAFGAVLYELLSGQRAFRGSSPADTMSAILREDPPDLAATRPDVPPALDRIVRHCLEKNPDERFQTARDVAFAIESLSNTGMPSRGTTAGKQARSRLPIERIAWAALAAALASVAIWTPLRRPVPSSAFSAPHRTMLVLPDGVTLSGDSFPLSRIAVSHDGTHVAFVGVGARGPMLWLQSLNETRARVIEGSENADAPFWSPDSRVLGFRRNGQMMTLDVFGSGGLETQGPMDGIAAWTIGPSGEHVILMTVGGSPTRGIRAWSTRSRTGSDLFLAALDSEAYSLPVPLFDGRHFVFGHGVLADPSTLAVYLGTFGSTGRKRLFSVDPQVDSINGAFASGYLLMARNQSITARALDPKTMTFASEPIDVAGPVQTSPRAGAAFSVSQNGVLVYESSSNSDRFRLTVYDRTGQLLRTLSDDAAYTNLELSPDGSQLALAVPDPATRNRDIWVIDVVRGVRSRVTFDPSDERSAVWSPDGKSLVYTSKGLDLYGKTVGTETETAFVKDGLSKDPRGWSPDGESFVYRVSGQTTRNDLWIKPRDPAKAPYPFQATPFDENYAVFAPDSRWMAYSVRRIGRPEVYATSFPSGQGKVRISADGGTFPDGGAMARRSSISRPTASSSLWQWPRPVAR